MNHRPARPARRGARRVGQPGRRQGACPGRPGQHSQGSRVRRRRRRRRHRCRRGPSSDRPRIWRSRAPGPHHAALIIQVPRPRRPPLPGGCRIASSVEATPATARHGIPDRADRASRQDPHPRWCHRSQEPRSYQSAPICRAVAISAQFYQRCTASLRECDSQGPSRSGRRSRMSTPCSLLVRRLRGGVCAPRQTQPRRGSPRTVPACRSASGKDRSGESGAACTQASSSASPKSRRRAWCRLWARM